MNSSPIARPGNLAADPNDEGVEYPGCGDGHDQLNHANRGVPALSRQPSSRIVSSYKSISRKQRLSTDYDSEDHGKE